MKKKDLLQKFMFEHTPIRGGFVHLDHSYQTIINQHAYSPPLKRLMGEALVLVSLLSGTIKFNGRLTIQFQGKNKLRLLLVQATQDFHIRGLIQFNEEPQSEEEILSEFKNGVVIITMEPDDSTLRYQGIVSWQGNTLSESIEGYFRDSEQLLTRVWIAVDDKRACGLLLQAMPGGDASGPMRPNDPNWEHVMALTETLKAAELLKLDNKVILHRLYHQEDLRLFEATPVIFHCTCSLKRSENAILMLGRDEATDELQNNQVIDVTCEFCGSKFTFDRVDVEKIFRKGDTPPTSTQVH
jgi:molecular chaperone Hsp33